MTDADRYIDAKTFPYTRPKLGRYVVMGVWADGNPVDFDEGTDDYAEAVRKYEEAYAQYHRLRQPPFIGLYDREDPERGYGPWEED